MHQSVSRFGKIYEKLKIFIIRIMLGISIYWVIYWEIYQGDCLSLPTQDFETDTIWNSLNLYCETDSVPRGIP